MSRCTLIVLLVSMNKTLNKIICNTSFYTSIKSNNSDHCPLPPKQKNSALISEMGGIKQTMEFRFKPEDSHVWVFMKLELNRRIISVQINSLSDTNKKCICTLTKIMDVRCKMKMSDVELPYIRHFVWCTKKVFSNTVTWWL